MLDFDDESFVDERVDPMMSVSDVGLHVVSGVVSEKISKKKLSASAITGLESCPARWAAESFVVKDIVQQEPDNAARRGSLFHKIMEDFFSLPKEDRLKSNLKGIIENVFSSDEFCDLDTPVVRGWVYELVGNYYSMGAKPKLVDVAVLPNPKFDPEKEENDWNKKNIVGLEAFVEDNLIGSGRSILGFIDRIVVDRRDGESLIVEDWKTGAKMKKWNPKVKDTTGLSEARQQVIYTMLLEKMGYEVSAARLIYPAASGIVDVDIDDKKFRRRVLDDVEKTNDRLDSAIAMNTFDYSPSFLCAWCPIAKICPRAEIKPYQKMKDAYDSQPDADILLKGFKLI